MAARKRGVKRKTAGRKVAKAPRSARNTASKAKPAKAPLKPARKSAPTAASQSAPHSEGRWAAAFAPRAPGERRYWLVKSEPTVFSFDDLLRAQNRTTCWDGVRNFAARNFLRDGMKLGDRVFFYHSMDDPQKIVGICEVAREGYPDHTALDAGHPHFDPGSDPNAPQWYMVDVRAVAQFTRPVTLPEIKARKELSDMALLRIGRLSVTPVTDKEWEVICEMAS
jgi:predicted RNA-binding protein with PUA-like domain